MRRAANIDANQPAIVKGLRARGVSVSSLAAVGGGVPDLLCGFHGRNVLLEIKDPTALRGKAQAMRLTPDEQRWHDRWSGQVAIVTTLEGAWAVVTARTP